MVDNDGEGKEDCRQLVLRKINPLPQARLLADAFTLRFLVLLSLMYGCVKGLAYQALLSVQLPYYRHSLSVSSSEDFQRYNNISQMAFCLKPLVGIVSDLFPLGGYHKRHYLSIYCLMSVCAVAGIAMLPGENSSAPAAAALFFLAMLGVAATDLLCEGKYSEMMAVRKDTGSGIVTWIWACYMLGGIIASSIEGPLADSTDPRVVVWVSLPMFLIPLVPIILGWVPESRKSEYETNASLDSASSAEAPLVLKRSFDEGPRSPPTSPNTIVGEPPKSIFSRLSLSHHHPGAVHPGLTLLGVCTSTGAIIVVLATLFIKDRHEIVLAIIAPLAVALLILGFIVLPPTVAKANLFMFCKEMFYLQIDGTLSYFYTSDSTCIADGPHFSYTYFQTFGQIAANVAGMVGVFAFERFLSKRNFQHVFWITTGIKVVAALFDVTLVQRWNEMIGIPDHVMYMCGDAIIMQVASMLDFMPVAVLMSRMCPKGLEATMYALLAGFSNFGQSISRTLGYMFTSWLAIDTTTVPCNFNNLWFLIVIGHMIMPLAVIPLSIGLIPPVSMETDVDDIDHVTVPADDEEEKRRRRATGELSPEDQLAIVSSRSSVGTRQSKGGKRRTTMGGEEGERELEVGGSAGSTRSTQQYPNEDENLYRD